MADEPPVAADSLVQQLFERHLGLPRQLPDVLRASSSSEGAAWREAEELKFKVARGRALDYQTVPGVGSLLGLTYHPARPPTHSAQRKGQQPAARQRAHSTLWALVQPHGSLGINTALSAADAGSGRLSGFSGWMQEGFVDVTERASLEYSLMHHPASGLAAELDLLATLPKLPLLPQLAVRHRIAATQASQGVRHSSTLSTPLFGGGAMARVHVQEPASGAGSAGSTLSVEVEGRSRCSRGLAGGVKLSPVLSSAFHGASASRNSSGSSSSNSSMSDSDDEASSSSSSGGGGGKADQQRRRQLPGLRLQMQPAAVGCWTGVSGRWQQPWGSRLKSTLGYQGPQRLWNLELCQKLRGSLMATSSLAWDDPASLAAPAAAGREEAGGGAPHQLLAQLGSYVGSSKLRTAGLKLACGLPQPSAGPGARKLQGRQLQLEFSYDAEAGVVTHGLKLRLGDKGGGDYLQQRRRYDVGLTVRPSQRQLDLTFDFFTPFN